MSLSNNDPTKAPIVPTFTGMSVGSETLIRNLLNHLAGAISGIILIWLSTHGFSEHSANLLGFSLTEMISSLIASLLLGAAMIVWGWLQSRRSLLALVNNVIQAALTGQVPIAIASKATAAQADAITSAPHTSVVQSPPAPLKAS